MADKIKKDPLFEAINNMKVGQDPAKKKQSPISKYKRMNPWSRESFLAEYPDLSPVEREKKRREEEKEKNPWWGKKIPITSQSLAATGYMHSAAWTPGEGMDIASDADARDFVIIDGEPHLVAYPLVDKWGAPRHDKSQEPIGVYEIAKDTPPPNFVPMLDSDGKIRYYNEPDPSWVGNTWMDAELQTHIDKHGWPSNYPPLTEEQKYRLENATGRRSGMPSEPYRDEEIMPKRLSEEEARKRGGEGVGWIPYEPPEQPYYPPTDWETYQAEQPWAGSMSSPSGYHRIRSDSVRHQDRAKYEEWKEKRREAEVGMQERMVANPWFDRYLED